MTKEMLHIENFAGIRNADIELARMNVFIGPQASGKSVCAKLFFYFRHSINDLEAGVMMGLTKAEIKTRHRDTFLKYFPAESWSKGEFVLRCSWSELWIEIQRKAGTGSAIEISYASAYDSLFRKARQILKNVNSNPQYTSELPGIGKIRSSEFVYRDTLREEIREIEPGLANVNFFIPAGRNFFSTLRRTIFQFIADDVDIDPFLAEFASIYERALFVFNHPYKVEQNKKILYHIPNLLCGDYRRMKSKDYIIAKDDRQVALENCSSGQQEALPLVMTVWYAAQRVSGTKRSTLFIEEPEAHLYPSAQREVVHLFAAALDLSSDDSSSQYLITTHSPYILSALNNLMYAGKIARDFPARQSRVTAILDEATLIDPTNVRAYFVSEGRVESIIDAETELVRATLLDEVSNELSEEFGHLLDIEFEEAAA